MPISIHGREYVTVAERVIAFAEKYPNGAISTTVEHPDAETVRCKAVVWPDVSTPLRFFTGHSEENRKASAINRTSAVENAETSAIGRALGFLGLGIIDGIATADEVVIATNKEKAAKSSKKSGADAPPFETDPRKVEITRLVRALGFEPKSQEEWVTTVKSLTEADLMDPAAYDTIIERLTVRTEEAGKNVSTENEKTEQKGGLK
jgi:hypothetical protein